MRLNGIELISYSDNLNESTFVLDCSMEKALTLNNEPLWKITSGNETHKVYGSYTVVSVSRDGEYVHVTAVRELEPDVKASIEAINSNISQLESSTQDQQTQIDEIADAIVELAGGLNG